LEIEGTRYAINSSTAVIGRSSDVDITVADPGMSRRHLQISVAGDRVSAADLGSTNGFYVNWQKASNTVNLHHGDNITAGRTTIVFRLAPDPTTQPRRYPVSELAITALRFGLLALLWIFVFSVISSQGRSLQIARPARLTRRKAKKDADEPAPAETT